MNINIKGTNISLTPSITEYTNKRLEKISKLLWNSQATQCDVELARTTEHHNKGDIFRAEIHISGAGQDFYASSEQPDLYASIDLVQDEMLREIKSKKEKSISFVRRGGARVKAMVKGIWPWGKTGI